METEIINGRQVLCAGTASPQDLNFNVTALGGAMIRWSFGDDLERALARSDPGDVIIQVADAGVADDWFYSIRRARGIPIPRGWRSWRPPKAGTNAVLLAALAKAWPDDAAFDGASIWSRAPEDGRLRAALTGIGGVEFRRDGHPTKPSMSVIRRWLNGMVDQPQDALVMRRDRYGWCRIEAVRPPLHVVGS